MRKLLRMQDERESLHAIKKAETANYIGHILAEMIAKRRIEGNIDTAFVVIEDFERLN